MKYKAGDRVRFLNDVGGGTVNRVDDRGFVYVLTEDGFEVPVTEKDLVFTGKFSYTSDDEEIETGVTLQKPAVTKKPVKSKPEVKPVIPGNIQTDKEVSFFLGFVPENSGPVFNSRIACFLINDSPFFAYYLAGIKEGGAMFYMESGNIEPDTKVHLKSFDQTSLSKISDVNIQVILVSKGRYSRREPVDRMLNLNLVNFSKESYYRENDYFEEKAVLFDLAVDSKSRIEKENIAVPDDIKEIKSKADIIQKPKKKEPVQDSLEVDLHYDETELQNSRLTPGAILALQMSRFHAAIEEAISKNIRRLVIIHGLGQGTLKMQIRKELQEKYPEYIYQDASFKEYGFGATLIHIVFDKRQ